MSSTSAPVSALAACAVAGLLAASAAGATRGSSGDPETNAGAAAQIRCTPTSDVGRFACQDRFPPLSTTRVSFAQGCKGPKVVSGRWSDRARYQASKPVPARRGVLLRPDGPAWAQTDPPDDLKALVQVSSSRLVVTNQAQVRPVTLRFTLACPSSAR